MAKKKKKYTCESSNKNQISKTHLRNHDRLVSNVLKPEILLIGIFILALFIRLLYLSQLPSTPIFHGLAVDDEEYISLAVHILKGNITHKDFIYLNPLYPFFLAFIYLIFGHSNLPVVLIQGIIDAISCILIYYIASTLLNKRVGIISALTYACYGIAIFYTGLLLAIPIVIFFTLIFISSLLFAEKKGKITIFFISGILFALVILGRPNSTLFLFFLPLWFFTVLKNKLGILKSIQGFSLFVIGLFMVASLISIRNYSIEKKFSPFAVQGGINFYIGNNPGATGRFMSPQGISLSPIEQVKTSIHYAEQESGKILTPSQASRYWLFKGLKFIKDNPQGAFFLYIKKCALFWRKEEIPLNIDYTLSKAFVPIFQLPFISFGIIAPFAILGIILSIKRKNTLLLNLFICADIMSVVIFFISERYRLPMVPFLIICSSYTLHRLVEMIQAKQLKGIIILTVPTILLSIGINKDFKDFKITPISHYNNLGKIYCKEGELDNAIIALQKALIGDPNFVEAHCNLGIAYFKKGFIKEAIEEYQSALTINPNYAEAHYNLGNAYIKKGRLDDAILEFKKTLAINPNFAEAYTNLGSIYAQKGMFDQAITEFKRALTINPNFAEAHANLGIAYYYKENYKQAILHCDKAVELGGGTNPRLSRLLEAYR